jgi:hypothetical protein
MQKVWKQEVLLQEFREEPGAYETTCSGLGIDRRIILNLTFMEVWGTCITFVWLWVGQGVQLMTMW